MIIFQSRSKRPGSSSKHYIGGRRRAVLSNEARRGPTLLRRPHVWPCRSRRKKICGAEARADVKKADVRARKVTRVAGERHGLGGFVACFGTSVIGSPWAGESAPKRDLQVMRGRTKAPQTARRGGACCGSLPPSSAPERVSPPRMCFERHVRTPRETHGPGDVSVAPVC